MRTRDAAAEKMTEMNVTREWEQTAFNVDDDDDANSCTGSQRVVCVVHIQLTVVAVLRQTPTSVGVLCSSRCSDVTYSKQFAVVTPTLLLLWLQHTPLHLLSCYFICRLQLRLHSTFASLMISTDVNAALLSNSTLLVYI